MAHVPSPVRLLGVLDVQGPHTMTAMCHDDPMILRDDVIGDGEDGLCVDA